MRVRLAARALRLYLHHTLFRKRHHAGPGTGTERPGPARGRLSRELAGQLDEMVAMQGREPYAGHAHAFRAFFGELESVFSALSDRGSFARTLALLFPDVPYLSRL
eukprot:tig00000769_g4001.t1